MEQITSHVLMIRPVGFQFNAETALDNHYQKMIHGKTQEEVQKLALEEFDTMVATLRHHQVKVTVVEDTTQPSTPDSIFPNNWISLHQDGTVITYPMLAPNRRHERRQDIIDTLKKEGLCVRKRIDYSYLEDQDQFLEGTGSMVFDRKNKAIYAAVSARMNLKALSIFSQDLSVRTITFHASQNVNNQRIPIYHTNVMMCLGENFAVICLDSIEDVEEKLRVIQSLEDTEKEIIPITEEQVSRFAGNMLQLNNNLGKRLVVMSTQAHQSLTNIQKEQLGKHGEIVPCNLNTIETIGGGSARCMMAEIFLPQATT